MNRSRNQLAASARHLRVAPGVAGVLAVTLAALAVGVSGAAGATVDTPYDVVATESPDPGENSRFAERLSDAADLTGDGVRDVFASSWVQDLPAPEVGGEPNNDAGRIALINGATQRVVYKVTPEPQVGGNFGFYISVPGDVGPNRDGLEDLVSGASGYDVYTGTGPGCGQPEPNGCNENQGRGYVISGPNGQTIATLNNFNPQPNGGFASRIGAAGDVGTQGGGPRDGVPDILVAAPANDFPAGCGINPATGQPWPPAQFPANCRANEGEVFVVDGSTFGLIRTLNIPVADRRGPACGSGDSAASHGGACGSLGGGPQVVGDLNGDDFPDHLVPATGYNPDANRHGRIYIFSGANGSVLSRIDQPDPDPVAFFGLQDLDRFAPGDLNADGVPELYGTGFLQEGPGGEESAGRAWVFDGRASVAQGRGVLLHELRDPFLDRNRAFGWAVSRTDYNKDGRTDSYVSNLQGQNTTTSIFDGRDGSLLRTLALPPSEAQPNRPIQGGGTNNGSALGWSSRAPGDLNRDGEPDYVAAAPYTDVGGARDQGKVYFFLSRVPGGGGGDGPPAPPTPPAGTAFPGCPRLTANLIRGTAASNSITGTPAADRIFAGTGNDVVDALAGNDCIDLGPGTDRGQGGLGADLLLGGLGADRMSGSGGNDRLRGGASADRLIGGFGNDTLHGQSGSDRMNGERGRDRINGGSSNDVISAGSSGDRIAGDQGNDRIDGNSGNDIVKGNSGRDRLKGSTGRDAISAGSGNDRVSARDKQRDRISCGTGRDAVSADRVDRVARDCERVRRR
ncbi:MAG: hypothetical protein M3131_00065 [Actinomycetota bacterium]|nr:hypothetical protein [Actinomycetota bacterium]